MRKKEMMNLKDILLHLRSKKKSSNLDFSSKMFLSMAFLSFFIAVGLRQSDESLEINKNDIVWEQELPDFFNVSFRSGVISLEVINSFINLQKECRSMGLKLFDYFESIEQKVKRQEALASLEREKEILRQQQMCDEMIKNYVLQAYQLSDDELNVFTNQMLSCSLNTRFPFQTSRDVIYHLYEIANISNEEKLPYILERYQLTPYEFTVLSSVVHAEAKGDGTCYLDAYAVINSIYNRTKSVSFRNANGESLYTQVIKKGQYEVYDKQLYLKYMDDNYSLSYQAVLDFLYSEASIHNYLNFRSSYHSRSTDVRFVSGGNCFHNVMKDPVEEYVRFLSMD